MTTIPTTTETEQATDLELLLDIQATERRIQHELAKHEYSRAVQQANARFVEGGVRPALDAGMTVVKIAQVLGLNRAVINKLLRDHGGR